MPDTTEQSFSNHAKFDPAFHFVLMPIAAANFFTQVVGLVRIPSASGAWQTILAIAAIIAVLKFRIYALKVQDRVIRLEERLRLASLLPASAHPRIAELTESQLVALRFASDAELPDLFERTVTGRLTGKNIKKAISTWRPDTYRV